MLKNIIFVIFGKFKRKKGVNLDISIALRIYIGGKKQRTKLRLVTMSKFSFNLYHARSPMQKSKLTFQYDQKIFIKSQLSAFVEQIHDTSKCPALHT